MSELASPIIILPRTPAGRELLRSVLPSSRNPCRPDGELPDDTSIYNTDFDKLAEEVERDLRAYEQWCREQDLGGPR